MACALTTVGTGRVGARRGAPLVTLTPKPGLPTRQLPTLLGRQLAAMHLHMLTCPRLTQLSAAV